jgi:hypothetical protein
VIRRAVHLGIASALVAAAAIAAGADSAVGRWRFETATINNCKLTGDMTIQPASSKTGGAGKLVCTFTSVQSCPGPRPIEITVAQTCTGQQVNAFVTLDSALDKIVGVKPESFAESVEGRYAPDNFRVALSANGQEMTGTFVSLGSAFVRFVRLPDLSS